MKASVSSAGKLLEQLCGGHTNGLTDHDELDHVQTPLPTLVLGDEGLRPAQALGELRLGQLSRDTHIAHQGQEIAVEVG